MNREAYLKRIAFLFTGSFCLLGGPIAYQTFDPSRQVCYISFCITLPLSSAVYHQTGLSDAVPDTDESPVQTAEFLLSGALGAGFVVSLAVIRIYLGWSYVGNRLLSAAVAYEETGW